MSNNKEKREVAVSPPAIHIDYQHYEALLEGSNLTDQEKREFIDALWSVIVDFVSLGFGVHPMQQINDDRSDSETELQNDRDGFEKGLPAVMANMVSSSTTPQSDRPRAGREET
ncbi:MAG: hypothetical protein AAFV59_17660 [Pseudomonadota bacterium]